MVGIRGCDDLACEGIKEVKKTGFFGKKPPGSCEKSVVFSS